MEYVPNKELSMVSVTPLKRQINMQLGVVLDSFGLAEAKFAVQGNGEQKISGNLCALFYIIEGEGSFFSNADEYLVKKGDLIFLTENTEFQIFSKNPEKRLSYIFINFSLISEFLSAIFACKRIIYRTPNLVKRFIGISEKLRSFSEEELACSVSSEIFDVTSYFVSLLVSQVRDSEKQVCFGREYNGILIGEVAAYLKRNLSVSIDVTELAGKFYLSPKYLGNIFSKATGKTIKQYHAGLRMIEAEKMLRDGDLRVSDIARKLGFNSIHYFTRTFKRLRRCSPVEYRRRVKESRVLGYTG